MANNKIQEIYEILLKAFGHQSWWPGDTQFEVIIGAILTQNTNWQNVEKAIKNIKNSGLMDPASIQALPYEDLAQLIRPAGYYNIKTKRIKCFLKWLFDNFDGDISAVESLPDHALREQLLGIKGVGRETADSIMLYAFNRPVFVVDAYTGRILSRHGLIDEYCDYEQLREFMQGSLPDDVQLFNEYHALLVRVGKDFCRPKPRCAECPLNCIPTVSGLFDE